MRAFGLVLAFFFAYHGLVAQVQDFAHIDFRKADSVARFYQGHSLDNLKSLSDKLTTTLSTDAEKFRSVYLWVCLNIESDRSLFERNQAKRKKLSGDQEALDSWNKEFRVVVLEELRKHKRTLCTGYSYLIKRLSEHAGIPCAIVDGYGKSAMSNNGGPGFPNHSWNMVQINNKWYLCDATWASGAYDAQLQKFVRSYNDRYFLLDPALFVRNHYPLDTSQMLLAVKPSLHEFLNRPLLYYAFVDYGITDLSPETFQIIVYKQQPYTFQFTRSEKKPIDKLELQLVRSGSSKAVQPAVQSTSDSLMFTHTFTEKGTTTVHVLLNSDLVATYSVTVR